MYFLMKQVTGHLKLRVLRHKNSKVSLFDKKTLLRGSFLIQTKLGYVIK